MCVGARYAKRHHFSIPPQIFSQPHLFSPNPHLFSPNLQRRKGGAGTAFRRRGAGVDAAWRVSAQLSAVAWGQRYGGSWGGAGAASRRRGAAWRRRGCCVDAECSGVTTAWGRREGYMGAVRAVWTRRGGGSVAECSCVGGVGAA